MTGSETGATGLPSEPQLADLRDAFERMRIAFLELGFVPLTFDQGVLLVDPHETIVYATPGMGHIVGTPASTLLGMPLSTLLAHLEPGEGGGAEAGAFTLRRPDGTFVILHKQAVPLVRDGRRFGTMHMFHDTTGAVARARELAEKSRELDEARTRLTRAQHMKALGELAAEVAHEFGNLLQAIGLQAAGLRRYPLPQPVEDSLRSIRHAIEIGQDLTRRLLTFARDDRGAAIQPIDVGRVLRDLVQLLEPRLNKAAVPLRVQLSVPSLPDIRADQTRLTEAFLNLFLNALDAMPGGGTLEVSATEASGEIRIAVRDTGKGMSANELSRAFDPFFTTKPGGTGLGLSTVYGVVRAHGGSVFLESQPGKGTTVFVSLPTATPPAAMPLPALTRPRESGRVLVVDDHPTVRVATSALLAAQGYEVESAGTVAEALAALERRPFRVVVTDVGLPDRPGWEVARAAKERSPETVVVLVSGWGSHFTREEARARGADLVFEKPVDPDVLLSAIDAETGPPA